MAYYYLMFGFCLVLLSVWSNNCVNVDVCECYFYYLECAWGGCMDGRVFNNSFVCKQVCERTRALAADSRGIRE